MRCQTRSGEWECPGAFSCPHPPPVPAHNPELLAVLLWQLVDAPAANRYCEGIADHDAIVRERSVALMRQLDMVCAYPLLPPSRRPLRSVCSRTRPEVRLVWKLTVGSQLINDAWQKFGKLRKQVIVRHTCLL